MNWKLVISVIIAVTLAVGVLQVAFEEISLFKVGLIFIIASAAASLIAFDQSLEKPDKNSESEDVN